MPTTYPKCAPSEMMGLLVLLDSHKGSDDVARLADDLDLEIDEILPALDFAELLDFVTVDDGHASLTETGRRLLSGSIHERKAIIREQLKRTTLFRTLARALDSAPGHRLVDDELARLVEFTTNPSEEVVQNIINWGRYADLFRYDSEEHAVVAVRRASPPKPPSGSGRRPPETHGGSRRAGSQTDSSSSPKVVAVTVATA
jgi:NitT/TauT family transport system ATP-binding protein